MDFRDNIVLKENYAFVVADRDGRIEGPEKGLYHRDTRFLSRYAWNFGDTQTLLAESPRPDVLLAHHARIEGPSQVVGLRRRLEMRSDGFVDRIRVENTGREAHEIELEATFGVDFVDMFEARGWHSLDRAPAVVTVDEAGIEWRYRATDGLELGTSLAFSREPDALDADRAVFRVALAPGDTAELVVIARIRDATARRSDAIPYDAWRGRFPEGPPDARHRAAYRRAVDDLRALLLFTEHGPLLAAGIPWFVAAFGRDSLLSALMIVDRAPDVAEGTLRYLAAHQGRTLDGGRAEAPGKIMHELRFGELTRTGVTPFGPYYGTVDATPLWVVLLHEHWKRSQSHALLDELADPLAAALEWMVRDGDADGDGFLEFSPAQEGEGLVVQSWKDSWDSMSHRDGSLATGTLAPCEVQGYAYAAFRAAAELAEATGNASEARGWRDRAARLRADFHEAFWIEDLATYAMALDGEKRPLRVHNSGAGQVLWSGIVPEEIAPRLVDTLFSGENYSGWGIRTLGRSEARYNPVSYHNGSVWPHDTALIAGGLARYGFTEHAARLWDGLFDLAASQRDARLPELVAGYEREQSGHGTVGEIPPVPYPVACRPQAWDAAALVYLEELVAAGGRRSNADAGVGRAR